MFWSVVGWYVPWLQSVWLALSLIHILVCTEDLANLLLFYTGLGDVYLTPWLLHIKERGGSMLHLECFMALKSHSLLLSVTWYGERTYSL